jgi:hypothetical protein
MKGFGTSRSLRARPTSGMMALSQEDSSDIELIHKSSPVATTSLYDTSELITTAERLSPKRNEDKVAKSLHADGWRFGAGVAAFTAVFTLLINFSIGVWAATLRGNGSIFNAGILVEVFHGSCDEATTMNTWSHLAINVLSTGLLAGSNYCMQCLVAPTREEVDRAHRHSPPMWLDIGLPSIRNLKFIDWRRTILWLLLALSSLPLHLL